ncbi:hypothetical protein PC120_g15001 [Phytophthora cactorum]|nr:hypothetical protein PC120_g15001 [Phytophthora cactorum]
MPFQLRVVAFVLRHHIPAASPYWVWESSCTSTESRSPEWSLANYLRSNLFYSEWQFREGLLISVRRGDVEMVKWFFDHFSGLEVPAEVVTAAASKGHLPVLQFLLENDQGRCCDHKRKTVEMEVEWSTGWGPTLPREDSWTESVPIMPKEWNGLNKHFQVFQWLEEHAPHKNDEEEANTIIEIAANEGSVIFAESILPEGNPGASASAIVTLAREGNLELMKRVARPHSKNRMSEKRATKWEWRMSAACKRGDLLMVKWMAEHPIGQELRRCPTGLLRIAAQNGHLPVLEYLF